MSNYPPSSMSFFYPLPTAGLCAVHIYKDETAYAPCPRCKGIIDREYQFFCDSCGQRIDWFGLDDAKEVYIGWSGPRDDEEDDDEVD